MCDVDAVTKCDLPSLHWVELVDPLVQVLGAARGTKTDAAIVNEHA